MSDPPVNVPPPPVNVNPPAQIITPKPDDVVTTTNSLANVVVRVAQLDVFSKPFTGLRLTRIKHGTKLRVTGKTYDEQWWRVDYQGTQAWVKSESVDYADDVAVFSAPAASAAACMNVCITSPATDSTLTGDVELRGTASHTNFAGYKVGFEDSRCAGGFCLIATFDSPVVNGKLMQWKTSTVPNGAYTLALVIVDKTGNELPQRARIKITINN